MTATEIEHLKRIIRYIFEKKLEPMAFDLQVYKNVTNALIPTVPALGVLLDAERGSRALRESVRKQYHEALESLLQQFSESILSTEDEKLLQSLESMNPEDPTN
jgi:hypothetical protein